MEKPLTDTFKVPELVRDDVYRVKLPNGQIVYRTRAELESAGVRVPPPAKA